MNSQIFKPGFLIKILNPTKRKIGGSLIIIVCMLCGHAAGKVLSRASEHALRVKMAATGFSFQSARDAFLAVPLSERVRICGTMTLVHAVLMFLAAYVAACILAQLFAKQQNNGTK